MKETVCGNLICGWLSLISLIFVFSKTIVEWAAEYLRYAALPVVFSRAPQLVIILSLSELNSIDKVPALNFFECGECVGCTPSKKIFFCLSSNKISHWCYQGILFFLYHFFS